MTDEKYDEEPIIDIDLNDGTVETDINQNGKPEVRIEIPPKILKYAQWGAGIAVAIALFTKSMGWW